MEKAEMNVEMSAKLKNKFDEVCDDLGLAPEEAMNIFAQKMVNEQAIPFEITEKDYPIDEEAIRKEKVRKICKYIGIGAGILAGLSLLTKLCLWLAKREIRKEEKKIFFWK